MPEYRQRYSGGVIDTKVIGRDAVIGEDPELGSSGNGCLLAMEGKDGSYMLSVTVNSGNIRLDPCERLHEFAEALEPALPLR